MSWLDTLIQKIIGRREDNISMLPPGIHEVYPDLYLFREPVSREQLKEHLEILGIKEK